MTSDDKPVLVELDVEEVLSPADAPIILETSEATMQRAARFASRPRSRIGSLFWGLLAALLGAFVSVAVWDFVTSLLARNEVLGSAVLAIALAFLAVLCAVILREIAGFLRLGRIDSLQKEAAEVQASHDIGRAKHFTAKLQKLYKNRHEAEWGLAAFHERAEEQFDATDLMSLAENKILAPLDAEAILEIQSAARQVATVTAFVPMAFADVIAALTMNMRMIRRIAEIYGGRAGTLGSWRLTKVVLSHLVATGAVAVGDDLIGSIAGGGVMSKVSRRFGEGIINGALTARVGVAALEVCRPMPFVTQKRPRVTTLVQRAMAGLFSGKKNGDTADS
ncbi:YcjF family protein [Falsihalocynthiibacter sp. S25ZX9]|uniref:YcjF family protein n=1 Tax=unclassified Falsihalocynthiibacter TaxID=2854191 RepID=UPI00350FE670